MSLRLALVTTLLLGDLYGLQIHGEVVSRTARKRPLNVGQVYATLDRLASAALVRHSGTTSDGLTEYGLTDSGRDLAERWCRIPETPVTWEDMREQILLVSTLPGVETRPLVAAYRTLWARSRDEPDDLGADAALRSAALTWLGGLDDLSARSRGLVNARPRRGRRPVS